MQSKRIAEIKTIEGWHRFSESSDKHNWDDYCKCGDYVDEEVYDYFLDILPPRSLGAGYLQVGEPLDSRKNPETGRFADVYSTFKRVGKANDVMIYQYLGACFAGGLVSADTYVAHKTLREFLMASRRPRFLDTDGSRARLYCMDGFNVSVQAGEEFESVPREDLPDCGYTAVELGFPSEFEECLHKYAEDKRKMTHTVYCRVPVEVVEALVAKHGGFFESRMPVVARAA